MHHVIPEHISNHMVICTISYSLALQQLITNWTVVSGWTLYGHIKGCELSHSLLGHILSVFGRAIIHLQLHSPSHFLFLEMGASPVSLSLLCIFWISLQCVCACVRACVRVCVCVHICVYSKWVMVRSKSDPLKIRTALSCMPVGSVNFVALVYDKCTCVHVCVC